MLQEAAVGSCNGGCGGYNNGSYNGGSGYNIGGYTMVVFSALHRQLCWEFRVSHNSVCIISESPLIYMVSYLETLCSQLILLAL